MPKKEIHIGIVTDNDDPDKRGRLTVECPTIVSGDVLEWVEPIFSFVDSSKTAGSFFVPNIGSQVEVEIEAEEDSQINGLEAKWRCSLYPYGTVPEEFTENYPQRRGWKTSAGHVFYFDDTDDSITFQYTHPSGTEIKVDNDGNITLGAGSGKSVLVGSDADEFIVRGNILETFLNDLKSWADGHKHTYTEPLHPGPSISTSTPESAPLVPDNSPSIPSDILSDDHKVK